MEGVKFNGANGTMGKPGNMTDEDCYALPVQFSEITLPSGGTAPTTESVWELSDEEMIKESKRVRLIILGKGMPPVSMRVASKEE